MPSASPGAIVVGIAGSAGSLAALQTFFSALPDKTGMAFVVVTHLSPEHESHMAALLQSQTKMTVLQVNRRLQVKPDSVYVISPGHNLVLTDSHLDIEDFSQPRGVRRPIDFFFRTLAKSHRNAIAIILSGGGTDGSVGAREIKEEGGLLMVQDPEEAEYSGMPASAISTGLADVVLPARELAVRLMEYREHLPFLSAAEGESLDEKEWAVIQEILAQVHRRTKHDFAQYKRSTMRRRVRRRMVVNTMPTFEAYLDYMLEHPAECFALLNDLLIGVTNFFRDHESWDVLSKDVLPGLFSAKKLGEPIRIWSVGCSSGEEAYSMAIACMETATALGESRTIQIFASDIDDDSLARAREGLYPAAIEADVSQERLNHFFIRQGDHYQMRRELRDMVLFTPHSVLRDPPFSRQDLIICRNLLIYLQRDIQQYVLDLFHYALNPGGYLFLGTSESVADREALFKAIHKNHRIYQSIQLYSRAVRAPAVPLPAWPGSRGRISVPTRPTNPTVAGEAPGLEAQHRESLEGFGPPSMLVSGEYAILHLSETAGRFLRPAKGPITPELFKIVRPELQGPLRTVLFQAFERGRTAVAAPVVLELDGEPRAVVLSAYPQKLADQDGTRAERRALVVFLEDEVRLPSATDGEDEHAGEVDAARIAKFEAEIQGLRGQLQTTTEDYESTTEEMKAANEELQSINEEYHLTTEELETSKEELEAVNEELQTVNNELKAKLEEISRAHKDLENVMGATEIATLFLDRSLRIQRYTPSLSEIISIIKADIGRPVADLNIRLGNYTELTRDADRVLGSLNVVDREIEVEGGKWYLARFRPYPSSEDKVEGVVVTFVNITAAKQADKALREMNQTLEARVKLRTGELETTNRLLGETNALFSTLFHVNPIPTSLTRMEDGRIFDINEAYANFFGVARDQVVGHTAGELGLPFKASERPGLIARVRAEGVIRNMESEVSTHSGKTRSVLASLQYTNVDGQDALLSTFIDITDRVNAERRIRALASNLTVAEQRERHRISQLLHDDLQQRLFSAKMQLTFLQEAYQTGDQTSAGKDSANIEGSLNGAIDLTRRLSVDLSPVILKGEHLGDALDWLADEMRERYSFEVEVEVRNPLPRLEEEMRVLFFYTVRELLFNAVKHADTHAASVKLESAGTALRVTVHDRGKGFDSEAVLADPRAAHSLLQLRNRLNLLGCTMEVKSKPGDGTEVIIQSPAKAGS